MKITNIKCLVQCVVQSKSELNIGCIFLTWYFLTQTFSFFPVIISGTMELGRYLGNWVLQRRTIRERGLIGVWLIHSKNSRVQSI
jgi:hypothetical protein